MISLASIFHLLARRSPSAVAGLIRAVIVDSVKGAAFWSRPHICEEC
jgi:hypothetical protein